MEIRRSSLAGTQIVNQSKVNGFPYEMHCLIEWSGLIETRKQRPFLKVSTLYYMHEKIIIYFWSSGLLSP